MEKKMTKRDFYNEIMALANDNERTDIVEFCEHEIELLDRKKSNGKAKVNEAMDKNVELVYNALAEIGKSTASELIAKADLKPLENELGIVSTQKVSAYLNKLVASGRVEKTTEKKKTYFSIVEEN
jgi:superfamily I DNA/RNA helicase